jgi:drug/metabolite transporter (DMT)-like permease
MRRWILHRRRVLSTRLRAVGLLWLATVVWALTLPLYKLLLTVWTPLQIQFWRYALATLLVVGIGRLRGPKRTGRDYVRALLLSLTLWVGFMAQTYGIRWTTASKAAFLTSLAILFGPLLALGVFGRRAIRVTGLRTRVLVAYWFLVLIGTALVTIHEDWTWRWNGGDVLCVAASLAFAVETVLIDRWVTPAQARWYAGFQMAGLTFWTALWSFLTGSSLAAPANPTWAWALVVLLAVFPSWLAFEWQMTAQPRLKTFLASFVYALEPLQGALLSVFLLGERLSPVQWAGGLLLVGAITGLSSRMVSKPARDSVQVRSPRGNSMIVANPMGVFSGTRFPALVLGVRYPSFGVDSAPGIGSQVPVPVPETWHPYRIPKRNAWPML